MDYDSQSRDEILGIVNVNLKLLRDQAKHDDWFELVSNKGMRSNGKILLSMQWVYSNVRILSLLGSSKVSEIGGLLH